MAQLEDTLVKGLTKVKESGDYSDLTITCGDTQFKVHRAVVCSQSGFFKAACKKGFQEGDTGIIDLRDEDESLVQAMIDYLYTEQLTITTMEKFSRKEEGKCYHDSIDHSCMDQTCYLWPCGFAIAVYAMGDKYDVPGLRVCSCEFLRRAYDDTVTDSWADDVKIFEFAYQQSNKQDELRSWLVEKICDGFDSTVSGSLLYDVPGFYPFIDQSPELAVPLLRHSLKYYKKEENTD